MRLEIFDDINSMISVLDYDTNDVIYLNRRAREHFGIGEIQAGLKQEVLFEGDDYILGALSEEQPEPGAILTKVLPALCGLTGPVLLECFNVSVDDRHLRVCSFRPLVVEGENSDSLYTMMFESSYLYIDANYHGIDFAEENIRECLSAVYDLYMAERAYILDIDEQLEAGEYLCQYTADGFTSSEYGSNHSVLFSNLFSNLIKKENPLPSSQRT